ncbi:MAG TPA: ABC transporter ATP-binding protein [Gaiellaceae bacterium]|jgi:oligopeptide/dipeptide ABC transporter ATP-binding protein|nr:ABC transporter ATP-binding protein [Gaiellaceae bacterium]
MTGAARDLVLEVRDLETNYYTHDGVVKAVRKVSFEIERGQRVGVVGESGSGKSALALSIVGLIEPPGRVVGGSVVLNGRDIATFSDRQLQQVRGREISLVFQDPMTALDPVKTIGAQIAEAILRHRPIGKRAARRNAVDLLRDVEVPHANRRLDDYPHQYSGGMRQRVLIAIALANEPDLVIADEPTTALDVTTQAQVLDVLERLVAERKAAVMLITHNLGVVAEFCDRVFVMYAGRLVERAYADDLFARQAHPYSEALLSSVLRPDRLRRGPLPTIPGVPPSLVHLPPGCPFEPRCPVGRGLDVCRTQVPPPVAVGDPADPGVAECHFAEERWSGAVPSHASEGGT